MQTSVVEQLVDVYFKEETWHKNKLDHEEAIKYHTRMLDNGNIICYLEDDKLLGYVEFWRINYEQFGRLVCHAPFSGYLEDVTSGNIAYVANTWIHKDHRFTNVYKEMKKLFFKENSHCDYYVGEAIRKKTGLIKVFAKANLKSRLFKKGEK